MRLITTIGDQEQECVRHRVPSQVVKKVQAGVVAPMYVFYDEKDEGVHREVQEKFRQHGEETTFLLFWFESWERDCLVRDQFRKQRKNITCQGLYSGGERRC